MGQKVLETETGWMIRCPGCGKDGRGETIGWHEFPRKGKPGASWTFNGDVHNPTFSPSMNECVNPQESPHHNPRVPTTRCHFMVTNGAIFYCGDCTHNLAGQSFVLEDWPQDKVDYYEGILKDRRGY